MTPRIIKFRAWYKLERKMLEATVSWATIGVQLDQWCPLLEGMAGAHPDDLSDLMQFTGLHDKNGKEIYEGDVVVDEEGFNFSVGWNEDGFWELTARNDTGELEPQQEPMGYMAATEVIGNIYENKELLK